MIEIKLVLLLMIIHWICDFTLHSDFVAKNKSKSINILSEHILIYSISFTALLYFHLDMTLVITTQFFLITAIAHFITDYITSKMTSKLFAVGDTHNGFVVVGFDQFLHITQLILTVDYIYGN